MGIREKIQVLFSGDPLWAELVAAYDLKPVEGTQERRMEGRAGMSKVVLEYLPKKAKRWYLTVGEVKDPDGEEIIELERRREDDEIDPEEDLAQIPGLAGTELAGNYIFAVHPVSEDYSSLSLPVVREGLPLLSKAIISVMFYLPSHSLVLSLSRADLTREAFDGALQWSVEAVKAMGG
ncbi:MAG TPA: hypothetical protein VM658_18975 [bacterium]|nr:hypothetical protein [bacterium]